MDDLNTLPARIRAKIQASPSGCLLWTGSLYRSGYAMVWYRGKNRRGHRLAWELLRGPIPDGLNVLHDCDTPPCMNPECLFLGTQADNVRDMFSKGRGRPGRQVGTQNGRAKLDPDTAEQVRDLRAEGMTQREIGAIFGVNRSTIGAVCRGERWSHG